MVPRYTRPVRYDTSKARRALGEIEMTPVAEAVGKTITWLVAEAGRS